MNFLKRYIIIMVSVAGAWFGFANPIYHCPPLALLFPMGMIFIALDADTPRGAFRLGILGGLFVYGACLYWVAMPVHNYGGVAWPLAAPVPLLLALPLAIINGLFCYGIRLVKGRLNWLTMGLFTGFLWGLLEALRGTLFTGFPWLVLPEAFAIWPMAIQGAALVGVYGLAGLMTMSVGFFTVALVRSDAYFKPLVAALIIAGSLGGYGYYRLTETVLPEPDMTVALVQGNIEQSQKWEIEFQNSTVDLYRDLTREVVAESSASLVVWPETALPIYLQEETDLAQSVRDLAAELGIVLVTGSPGYEVNPDDIDQPYIMYNRAYLVDERGELTSFYDKEHLVPFGEYVPFKDVLFFIDKMVQSIGDFGQGLKTRPLNHQELDLGVLICYESIFPVLAQKRVEDGADILINISNDGWFGPTSGPIQHFHLSLLRAVEQQRYLIRATNTGISTVIDPMGRILTQSAYGETATLTAKIGVIEETTIFHRIHWFILPVLSGLVLLFLVFAMFKHPRED